MKRALQDSDDGQDQKRKKVFLSLFWAVYFHAFVKGQRKYSAE
jgi:hypothetical protein